MQRLSRTQYAFKNTFVSSVTQVSSIIIQYVCRIVFVRVFAQEYVGINGIFTNILQMLSLAELGFGSAISYSLYKPISDNNFELIKTLLKFFKNTFYVISVSIFLLGLLISFNLDFFINDVPDIAHIQLIFMLYVVNISFSYLGTYKTTLINASQQAYVCNLVEFVFKILLNILQIVILLVTHNFIFYVAMQGIVTIMKNIIYINIANYKYPFLKDKSVQKMPKRELKLIATNVKAMFLHKIGWVAVDATDNILISKLIDLSMVARYSNYVLITQSISLVLNQIFNSIVASVGNLGVTETNEKKQEILYKLFFFSFVIYCIISAGVLNVSSDFVELCFGKKYSLGTSLVIIISLNFFLNGMRKPAETFLVALGLFNRNRYAAIFEAVINLFLSVILAKYIGMIGILIGTTFSTLLIPFWVAPCVVVKGIEGSLKKYFGRCLEYIVIYAVIGIITFYITRDICTSLILQIIIKGITTVIISFGVIVLIFRKTSNFEWLCEMILQGMKRKIKG